MTGMKWSRSEKERFYQALRIHGFDLKKVEKIVGSWAYWEILRFVIWFRKAYKERPDKRYEDIA